MLWRYRTSAETDALWQDLSAAAHAKGFFLGDTLPAFQGVDLSSVVHSPVDAHPNAEGSRVAAERIAELLAPLLPTGDEE